MSYLPGDVVVAAAFMSYAGPFPSEYRDELVKHTWLPQVWGRGPPEGVCARVDRFWESKLPRSRCT
jgi:hypothetical protein